jgi:hypothetical protein
MIPLISKLKFPEICVGQYIWVGRCDACIGGLWLD